MKAIVSEFSGWIRRISLEKKVSLLLSVTILLTALSLLAVTTASAVNSLARKSHDLAAQQIESLSRNMETSLNDYRELIMMLMLDDRIQAFLKSQGPRQPGYTMVTNAAYQSIAYIRNAKSSIAYIMVAREDTESAYLYNGASYSVYVRGSESMLDDYAGSTATAFGSLRYQTSALPNGQRILHLYQPIFDKYRLNRRLGILCIGIDEETLSRFCSVGSADMRFHIRITDQAGAVLYDLNRENIGRREPFAGQLTGLKGSFSAGGDIVIHQSIGRWGMRLIGSISTRELLADSYTTTAVLLFLIGILTLVSLLVCMRLIRRLCAPLREAVEKMQVVSRGDLSTRMNEENIGDDFREIAENFNSMLVRFQELMERVKLEERRTEQIRFNILQSQIQPHFLYNTLDCIHWQAASNGDREASDMVKVLASYYRRCLSRGQTVISLRQEIALVTDYLTIQNMRYDNIIDLDCSISEELYDAMLPKLTLQPLLENAIYHGVKDQGGKHGTVRLTAQAEGETVTLVLSDDGAGMSEEKIEEMNASLSEFDDNFGYGVRNVHKRMEILFGEGFGLHYRSNRGGRGLTVEIRIPRRWRETDRTGKEGGAACTVR